MLIFDGGVCVNCGATIKCYRGEEAGEYCGNCDPFLMDSDISVDMSGMEDNFYVAPEAEDPFQWGEERICTD